MFGQKRCSKEAWHGLGSLLLLSHIYSGQPLAKVLTGLVYLSILIPAEKKNIKEKDDP